jgi:predicted Zn-dependent protease
MAHEIAHVAARHGVEQASKATLANYAMIPLIFMSGGLGAIAYNAAQIGVPLAFLKFGRGAESEADKLGAQYMWAAGYDPHYFMTFFEKLDKKEKNKPGTLSKLFGTHPPTGDRAVKVRDLLTRFPDREEYTLSTSEFSRVKSRLLAITNAKTLNANGERDTGPKRPTLKRRQEGGDPNTTSTSSEEQTTKDRPTLKRRDSDGKPPEKKP